MGLAGLLLMGCGSGSDSAGGVPAITTSDTGCPADDTTTSIPGFIVPTSSGPSTTVRTTTSTTVPDDPGSSTTAGVRPLAPGDTGPAVEAVQDRLLHLGFWLIASGAYDDPTLHAVTAFEKVNDLERDGHLSVDDLGVLTDAERPVPRSNDGPVIEIDLGHQVVLIAHDGTVEWVFDTSTGAIAGATPTGWFAIYREIDGIRISHLGELYRPKYVIGGVAMHGYPDVPAQPASHGCIRVTNDAMDLIWALDLAPLGTPVFVYGD